ncbi:MAG: tetratricopeptide repeat protein [Candidatus Korobacteraceae bacterium]|jgi:protein O-mannosyl-transferase
MTQSKVTFRREGQAFVFALLLLVATLTLYRQVRDFQFIEDYDDGPYVTQNINIKYFLDWETVKWAFTTYYAGNWDPLTWLSHSLDCRLYHLDSGRHHETNALLHALNAVLLFWVLWRATGLIGRSWFVAALFAVHPINVESVAWVAERKNLLSMLFFLLALGAYRWYAGKPRVDRYLVVALLYACSLMSKAQAITFPFILLLWDYWPLRRMFTGEREIFPGTANTETIPPRTLRWLILEKVPLLVISAAGAVLTIKASAVAGAMSGTRNIYPLSVRLQNAIVSYPRYIRKAIWPTHLAIFYPYPKISFGVGQVAAALLFLALVTTAVVLARHRARYFIVGWLWFLGALVPMIGLVQVGSHPMADRFAYLPFIGLFIMACWSVADWAERRHISVGWLAVAGAVVLLVLSVVTYRQIGYWKDSLTLWSHAVQAIKGNDEAEDKLGSALVASGQEERAAAHFRAAVDINPSDPAINIHMGYVEQRQGNLRKAIDYYNKVLILTQSDIPAYASLRHDALQNTAVAYRDLGDLTRAGEYFEAAATLERQYRK